jgi:signal transduction histidine kinase
MPLNYARRPASPAATLLQAALLCVVFAADGARASCLMLPSTQLAELDHLADRDPEAAVTESVARIEALRSHPDAFLEAQLYAVIAEARHYQSRAGDTKEAAARAESLLDLIPGSPDVDRVRLRVRINVADTSESASTFETAVTSMNSLVAITPTQSAEHSCALSIRAQARSELGAIAVAAADAFEAYRIAEAGGWPEAQVTAAYVLATIYRRSGLLPEAERMIDEVVAFAIADHRTPLLSTASYVRGQILIDMHQFNEARTALELSHENAVVIGDQFGAAVANVPLCLALISANKLKAAERTCAGGEAEFKAAGTPDFLALLVSYRARLDLARHDPEAALLKLNVGLRAQPNGGLARLRAQTLRDRSRAYEALGRFREAYQDLQDSLDLESKANVERQALTVAVLSATAASEKLLASNHMLEERMQHQQEELAHRKATQELWFVLAVAAIMLSILFGWLLVATRRHERILARQEVIMRTMSSNAPDALMLLNVDRTVRFSNRSLLGTGVAPAAGTPLTDAVPHDARAAVSAAVDELEANRQPVTFPITLRTDSGEVRHFELRGVPIVEKNHLIGITLRSTDVTEFRRLEREVIDVASRERQRLSSDLHEGLGQQLTGISLLLASLSTAVDRGRGGVEDLISEVRDYVDRCIDMTRELARGLSPVQIERGSLGTALDRLAADASGRLRLRIVSRSTIGDLAVSDVAADHLYRIAYEALTNAARHSRCSNVLVELRAQEDTLELSVTDDGIGITGNGENPSGLGIKMMRYRVRLLGGKVHLGPGPNSGTQLLVSVPLASAIVQPGTETEQHDSTPTGQQDDDADQDDAG